MCGLDVWDVSRLHHHVVILKAGDRVGSRHVVTTGEVVVLREVVTCLSTKLSASRTNQLFHNRAHQASSCPCDTSRFDLGVYIPSTPVVPPQVRYDWTLPALTHPSPTFSEGPTGALGFIKNQA